MMKLFILMLVLMTSSAHAQTTPTANETRIGTTCTKSTHSTDFDTLAQCTSTDGTSGTMQKSPLFIGAVTAPPYTTTICDVNKEGMIQYDGTDILVCNGSAWNRVHTEGLVGIADGSATSPSLYFTNDTDTGMYRQSTNTIGFTTGGVLQQTINTNGIVVQGYGKFYGHEIEIRGTQNVAAPFIRFHRPAEEHGQIRYGINSAHNKTFYLINMNEGTYSHLVAQNITAHGTIKAGGSNLYPLLYATLNTYHSECVEDLITAVTLAACTSACGRYCRVKSYSGGVIQDWGPIPACTCIP